MVHLGDGSQAFANEPTSFRVATSSLPEERSGDDSGEQVGNCQQVVAGDAFPNQQAIKADAD